MELFAEPWPTFEDWWGAYEKKIAREKCIVLYSKIPQKEREVLFRHTEDYVRATPDKQYRKHPATYLRGRCWEDEIIKNKEYGSQTNKGVSALVTAIATNWKQRA